MYIQTIMNECTENHNDCHILTENNQHANKQSMIVWSSGGLTSSFQYYVMTLHSCIVGMHQSIIKMNLTANRLQTQQSHTNITANLRTNKISTPCSVMLCKLLFNTQKKVLIGCIPELVESLLVSLKHMPHVEVQGVGCVPFLQLLEVGVLCESHGVQRGFLCSAMLNQPG